MPGIGFCTSGTTTMTNIESGRTNPLWIANGWLTDAYETRIPDVSAVRNQRIRAFIR